MSAAFSTQEATQELPARRLLDQDLVKATQLRAVAGFGVGVCGAHQHAGEL